MYVHLETKMKTVVIVEDDAGFAPGPDRVAGQILEETVARVAVLLGDCPAAANSLRQVSYRH